MADWKTPQPNRQRALTPRNRLKIPPLFVAQLDPNQADRDCRAELGGSPDCNCYSRQITNRDGKHDVGPAAQE
jgi:hypothetical protein